MLVAGAPLIPVLAVVLVRQVAALAPHRATMAKQHRGAPRFSSRELSHKANLAGAMMQTSSAVTKDCGRRSIQAKIAMAIWKTFFAVANGTPRTEKAAVLPPRPFFLISLFDD